QIRMSLPQQIEGLPVGHGRPAGEQTGIGDRQSTEAEPDDLRPSPMGRPQRGLEISTGPTTIAEPRRHHEGVGIGGVAKSPQSADLVPFVGPDRSLLGAEQERLPGGESLPPDLVEHHLRYRQVEHGGAVEGVDPDSHDDSSLWYACGTTTPCGADSSYFVIHATGGALTLWRGWVLRPHPGDGHNLTGGPSPRHFLVTTVTCRPLEKESP